MKKMRSILSIFLIAAMALSLAACGGKTENPVQEESPEFVYSAEYTTLSEGTDRHMNPQIFTEDGMYVSTWEKVGKDIPEGEVEQYEGQYDVYENRLYFVGYDGSMKLLEGYQSMAGEDGEGKENFYSSGNLSGIYVNADGSFYTLENVYSNWYDGPEGLTQNDDDYWMYMQYSEKYYIRHLNSDGSEISAAEITVPEGKYLNGYGATVDTEGNLVMSMDMGLAAVKPDGSFAYTIEGENYIDRVIKLSDGSVAALTWGETGMELLPIVSGAFGEPIDLPYDAYNLYPGGGDYDFYYTSGINFYGFDLETGTAEKLFNWISCDVNSNELGNINITADGKVQGVLNQWNETDETYTTELVTVSRVPYESVPHKESISMAVLYMDYQVQSEIINFNRHNDKYRIEVTDYSEYNTDEDYSAGQTKLTTEIMAGNVPDILAMNNLPYTQLAAKGLLEDLYPYIDADSEFKREDFFPNVLASLEVNGGLYSTVSGFYINTVAGAASVVGDTPGWTYDEFDAALASMPEGCEPFDVYVTRDMILNTCLALDLNSFVDWTNGKCSFDSQSFIDLLEFANRFPAEYNWEENKGSEESSEERIAQGKQMLMESYLFSVRDLPYNERYFGGNMTYIGYPTNSGTGSVLNLETGFAMSSACKNKEAAWEFMRTLFTEEYQEKLYNLPSNINVYNKQLEEAMTIQYSKDAEGNYILNEEGERIPIITDSWVMSDGTVYEHYALTQEQADKMWELITTTTKRYDYNTSILEIVMEQAEAYFSGQKSVEEVARLIQSKANIYVNEQR